MTIKSPYNFVPLNDIVVFPEWGDQVSHDIPFSDGESGEIKVKITLESEAYIRNGGIWNDYDKKNLDSESQEFFSVTKNGKSRYAIPGTSIKGVLRNVLEIASFGKMNKVADHRYSIRDLYDSRYTSKMTLKNNNIIYSKVKSGWLTNEWKIVPCEFARVELTDLENYHDSRIRDLGKKQSSIKKYQKWGEVLDGVSFDLKKGIHNHSCGKMDYNKAINLGTGKTNGYIVFTGQASERKQNKNGKMTGKHMEFIFYNDDENNVKDVSKLRDDFEFIHSDERGNPNEEWAFWKQKQKEELDVPVFYLVDEKDEVESFGLAMMYRLPYLKTIKQAIENTSSNHFTDKADLSDLIFGMTSDKGSLKGRVQVSHFFESISSETNVKNISLHKTVLGGPRPTFYPNYVEQPDRISQYKNYMDSDVKIRGWKRYPAENNQPSYPSLPRDRNGRENTDVATMLRPLPCGTVFEGKIRFHNLRPIELGALIWVLTWGENKKCQHKIGMGKPLGLGRISVEIDVTKELLSKMNTFESFMSSKLKTGKFRIR